MNETKKGKRLPDLHLEHSDEAVSSCSEVTCDLTTAEHLKLLQKIGNSKEVQFWVDARIEWLMGKPKEASKSTRNDYLAILKWWSKQIGEGYQFSSMMATPGYYKPWAIKNFFNGI